jgi:lambda family phage portal protein
MAQKAATPKPRKPRAVRADATPPKMGATSSGLGATGFPGGYEGSQRQRRLFGFRPTEAGINSLLMSNGPMLRSRARYLVRNNPYAKKAQRVFVSHLVGTGIKPIPRIDDLKIKTAVEDLWHDWVEEADADGLVDFYGLQVLAARAMFDAGECFLRFRPRLPEDGLTVPFQIQLLESEFCPYELNMIADSGNTIRSGIEFDKIGRRVAYWFWKSHPGEWALIPAQLGYTRVPAEEVVHLFEPLRPGQIRGVSWLAAAIVRAFTIDQYEDAELERKKTAALFAGFITKASADDDGPLGQQDQPAAGIADTSLNAPDEAIAGLTPGMLQVLLQGEDIKFSSPADVGPNFEPFIFRALLALCAAMDMPYSSTTGDYSKANYSSERASKLDMRASLATLQNTVMIFQMCKKVYPRFIADAVLDGSLPIKVSAFNAAPKQYNRSTWIPPRSEWIDPQKDVAAEKEAVRSGFKSREAVIRSLGGEMSQVDAELARGNTSADKNGLVLDTDPRRTNERGSGPPPDLTAPPDTESPQVTRAAEEEAA